MKSNSKNILKLSKQDLLNNNIKKPSTPHVMKNQTTLTKKEYEQRMYADRQLEELGISTSVFDTNNIGYEDADVLKAIIIANQGNQIPEELKIRIINKRNRKHKASLHNSVKKDKVAQTKKIIK